MGFFSRLWNRIQKAPPAPPPSSVDDLGKARALSIEAQHQRLRLRHELDRFDESIERLVQEAQRRQR